ncbi:hypothetical protein CNEO4_2450013 [Clostridium neonatale]|uniref:Uncharacterized protein n=1 Tax=Clostridium neonatale TaxID=137838 RepID=A0AA86JLR5_9CLOT|nr:hypothetical protein CNEO_10086 [Clostridium neonatale]CAG9713072.1 hypothetical protein CNEO_1870012 [Clostridium neonatale]CAI3192610.1 hypothetical protein CNEO2_1080010 [Clostridium neonatale]CAI3211694.1 hypothetical protein CNEO2_700028 [Clostridium neonatale]CAI3214227.1 hypothetical protein CNEO2_710012 [Clostridium neonatale]
MKNFVLVDNVGMLLEPMDIDLKRVRILNNSSLEAKDKMKGM